MAYKALLGVGEVSLGVAMVTRPHLFERIAAPETRNDPGDSPIAILSRHLPVLLQHRVIVASALIALGVAKLVAAAAMWYGRDWGRLLLLAILLVLLPFDLVAAVHDPSVARLALVVANLGAASVLAVVLRPSRHPPHAGGPGQSRLRCS